MSKSTKKRHIISNDNLNGSINYNEYSNHHNNSNHSNHSNGWSSKKERMLQVWMDECNIYSKLYAYNVIWYERLDNILGIVGTLLSAITGASLLNSSDTDRPGTRNIIITFGALSMVNTFIQATKEYLNLKTVINSNLIASRQNRMVCIDIEAQLNLSRHERIEGKEFLTTIRDRKNDLILNGPVISNRIWKKIVPKYNTFKTSLKESIDEEKIKINNTPSHEYSNNSSNDIVYKRRPTMEVINLSNEFNEKTKQLETIIDTDTYNNNDNDNVSHFKIDIDNTKYTDNTLNNDISYTTEKKSISNTSIDLDEIKSINFKTYKKDNSEIHFDLISNLNVIDEAQDGDSEYTEEDDGEDTFLKEINNSNKACGEINIKLAKKPINELDHELKRFHI